CMQGQEFPWTF
nr:immunoglobulin light chain junction region [Macaca mulatta]